ncbi:MAG: excinuclease ABC subunit UvrB [SAR202 cluster bacterium]|nr:excinuclease ABC subunit UvrB [SAR202 cluster bacterium]|tara:strand:- start:7549 stop:9561 length:2013 start_codon:yes stop_codon:yes gene_type:complete
MSLFELQADYAPTGDQPKAIAKLVQGVSDGLKHQTLLGVTGSGKTFTMANVIEKVQKPTLVIAHNKTLAAQLATEFREFFPNNAVEYFVSYYDYYQPEAYVPRTDTYIEKESDINDEIDKLRHSATRSLLTREDVLIVASVSCIYGLGAPEEYQNFVLSLSKGHKNNRTKLIRKLVDQQYERNDMDLSRGRFRVRGDTLEILPAYEDLAIQIQFWGDEIEKIIEIDPMTGEILQERDSVDIYPAKHFVTSKEKLDLAISEIESELEAQIEWFRNLGKPLEAERIENRTRYDIEMLRESGYCSGVENYSAPLGRRAKGSTPWCLLDYFPDDYLLFVDESHMTIPQLHGMYKGDKSRKSTLVEYGFRLPSALDNRPLQFSEVSEHINQVIYVSATPSNHEYSSSEQVVEQVIRPTGLLDPTVEIKPTHGQIDDLYTEINKGIQIGQRTLVTTLTKRMAEELSEYLKEMNIKTHYLHSEIDTLQRSEILRDLRLGVYDVVVGINLLREGLDLPEVGLVAILDADKEGYLRSVSSLIQTIGRAARHSDGHVIMYADRNTDSMNQAIRETYRRRELQEKYNIDNNITPTGIHKAVKDISERVRTSIQNEIEVFANNDNMSKEAMLKVIKGLEIQMKKAAKSLEFEQAAMLRDEVSELRKLMFSLGQTNYSVKIET